MKIGIIGGGVVGSALLRGFVEHVDEVRVYDKDPARRTHDLPEVIETDMVFICLPTPMRSDGSCDTEIIDAFLATQVGSDRVMVIKSTVPIGFTRTRILRFKLPRLLHSPEFLTARCATTDIHCPSRNIIGAIETETSQEAAALLGEF